MSPRWAFFGQPETSSVCWQLGSIKNWSAEEKRPLEDQIHWCWAFTKRILGPPDEGQTCCWQWRFDSLVNSSPFSQGNTVCTYQFFFVCSIPSLKYTPSKVVQFFTAQPLLLLRRTVQPIVCFGASIPCHAAIWQEKRRVRILRRMGTFLATESVNSEPFKRGETKVQIFGKEKCKTHHQFQRY